MDTEWERAGRRARRGRSWILFGVFANLGLAAGKIAAGWFGRSQALIADGIESLLDVFSSLMIWAALHVAGRPPDSEHPYGHGKVESLAGVFGALVLLAAGALVAWHNTTLLFGVYSGELPVPPAPAPFTLGILLGVIAIKEFLFRVLSRRGGEAGSRAMEADAWHHRSDAITSVAAFIGISLALIGGKHFATADSWAALFSCAIIVLNGVRMLRGAVGEVIDEQGAGELVGKILVTVCAVPGVSSAEKCRVRKSGLTRIADLHVRVPGEISVHEGHMIAHEVARVLKAAEFQLSDVTVHIEPEPPGTDSPPCNPQ